MNQTENQDVAILSIVPAPLIPPVSKGQKHTYGLLDALGNITKVVSITDTHSTTAGHSFELRPLIEHKLKKYLAFGNYKLIVRLIHKLKPKAILLEQPFMGIIVSIASKKTKTPFSIHAHNVEFLRYKSLGKWWWLLIFWLERFAFRKAKNIFFISENDKNLAIKKFLLPEDKCIVSPYGVPQTEPIIALASKISEVRERHGISSDEKVFLFFGVMKYLQNVEAIEIIINEILPRLEKSLKGNNNYKVMICGGGLSDSYIKQLNELAHPNLIYVGYVHEIDEYTQCADVIINPVLNSAGLKTNVIDALGFNKPVVTTVKGSQGIDPNICGNKLQVIQNENWDNFVAKMIEMKDNNDVIPESFFNKYSWRAIAKNLLTTMIG